MKSMEEANELFKDENLRLTATRYTKALRKVCQFDVNELKVTMNLNLALSNMKMHSVDQALRVCNEALALDGQSVGQSLLSTGFIILREEALGRFQKSTLPTPKSSRETTRPLKTRGAY
jgi:hypothetical protein